MSHALPAAPDPERLANAIRALTMDAIEQAQSGHAGLPLGMADAAVALFGTALTFDAAAPEWPDRDRFVLSAGHGSMLLYAVLHLTGYPGFGTETLKRFRQWGSLAAGHPEVERGHGIETTTGPLGQGLANAVGMALAERILAARFGEDLVDHRTYVMCSDGDLMEGVSHEAASIAGHLCLAKLIVLYDDNDITIDGPMDLASSDDATRRFEGYGWHVERLDGHDALAVAAALARAKTSDRPSLLRLETVIGKHLPTRAGKASAHAGVLGDAEVAGARRAMGWDAPPFVVPADVKQAWEAFNEPGRAAHRAWRERLEAAEPERRQAFLAALAGELPADLATVVTATKRALQGEARVEATRFASGRVLAELMPAMPSLLGGSADLTPANNTQTPGRDAIAAGRYGAGYLHYGAREQAMAAAMNGMALHRGLIPFAGTFMAFADHARPALRLAALMRQRVIHVMTHDSIGLGEDGPTHQPVEHLAALRAIPNLLVLRPADAVEVAECWELALRHEHGPSILALSRQPVEPLRVDRDDTNRSARGAYVLHEATAPCAVTVLATGTEVGLAMAARRRLEEGGIGTRVVSMPCLELFEAQDDVYRTAVLGDAPVMVAVEAAVRQGWDRYIGAAGLFVGMAGFGASAPAEVLFERFGITADAVVAAVKARVTTRPAA
ncbi:MAG: transketolase [Pseudomonadota bacterium]